MGFGTQLHYCPGCGGFWPLIVIVHEGGDASLHTCIFCLGNECDEFAFI